MGENIKIGRIVEENIDKIREYVFHRSMKPLLSAARIKIVTKVYKETEGIPMIMRRAKVLLKQAQEIPIAIEDWQLIVGSPSAYNFSVSSYPEVSWKWVDEIENLETREGDKYEIPDEDKKLFKEILPWWKGKSIEDNIYSRLPEEVANALEAGLFSTGYTTVGVGNLAPNYEKVIKKGMTGIMEEIKEKMEYLDLSKPEDYKKWLFYKAAIISCEAVNTYAKRFEKLARELAEKETREDKKKELLTIAKNCERVPAYPARDFPEALQAIWFVFCVLCWDAAGGAGKVLGRLDQYLYPYYADYVKKYGIEVAKVWLKNFWINQNQTMYFLPNKAAAEIWSGHPMSEQPTIGGVDENGRDASNELTKLILEVEKELALPRPDIAVMYHKNIDVEVLKNSCDCLPRSMKPKFFDFETVSKQLMKKGATEKDIKKGAVIVGCVTAAIEGKSWGSNCMTYLSLPKCFELALNDGIDPRTGKRVGASTGDPTNFKTFNEFLDAVKKQIQHCVKLAITYAIIEEYVHKELNPQPLSSVLTDDCIEKGLPVWEGGACYNIPGIAGVGLATIADSAAALKKFVFDERKISMSELLDALHRNWEGKEDLRQLLKNQAPKFGNDDDYVDGIATEIAEFYCNEVMKCRSPRRTPYYPSMHSVSAHVGLGNSVGATPDGRKSGEPLSDGISPTQGVLREGPTAVIKSLTKIDHSIMPSGSLLNMKFSAPVLRYHRESFIELLKTYMELGGYHIQFNIIDTETLRNAQLHPEEYAGILVRVAAYVAEFTSLPKKLQEDIIARSELGLDY